MSGADKRFTFARMCLCKTCQELVSTDDIVCFIAILPLARLFEYGAEEMTWYLGHDLGDLVVVTLAKSVLLLPI